MLYVTSAIKWTLALFIFFLWGMIILLTIPFFTSKKLFPYSQKVLKLLIFIFGIRIRTHGLNNIDQEKTYVFMFNHNSFLDHFVIASISTKYIVGIEKISNFKIPIYGQIVRWWGNIPIVREDRTKALEAIQQAQQVLENGTSIGVAPEGTRSKTGQVGPFKKGGFHLAKNAHALILPITLTNMRTINPDGFFKVRSGTVDLYFHPPIDSDQYDLDKLIQTVRGQICLDLPQEGTSSEKQSTLLSKN